MVVVVGGNIVDARSPDDELVRQGQPWLEAEVGNILDFRYEGPLTSALYVANWCI